MIEVVRRVAPIVATGLVAFTFLLTGVEIEAKMHPVPVVSAEEIAVGRFQKLTDTTALDTKTGQKCEVVKPVSYTPVLPEGITLDKPGTPIYPDPPLCDDLAKQ